MDKVKIIDALGNEELVDSSSFELCQENKVLHDTKFETKTTTYLKDAFKRFCKNKSSVVAAIIIGILLVTAFAVPIFSKHDLSMPHLTQRLLRPRIFNAGTGFWDGTKKYEDIIYDPSTESPAGFKKDCISKIYSIRDEYLSDFSQYSHGGIYIFEASKAKKSEGSYKYDYLKHKNAIEFTPNNDISLSVKFNQDEEDFDSVLNRHGTYRIVLQKGDDTENFIVLRDWTNEYSDFNFNISEYLESQSISLVRGFVRFDVKVEDTSTVYNAIYLDSVELTTGLDPENEDNLPLIEQLENISITDANATKLLPNGDPGFWHSTGTARVIKTFVSYWTFRYDAYEDQLGYIENFEVGQTIMQEYIDKGYCKYDFNVGPESFEVLSDKCPIVEVNQQKTATLATGKVVINLDCNIEMYKYLGFNKMPRFIFGTDSSGFDLFTRAFSSLRTSLFVAIIISAICLAFGLCWGAISGYFGGAVDMAMERFCEILGGMPWIVLMTLIIIKWGNSLGTFAIASCITGWMGTAGTTRTQFYRFKGREYILSSRTLGSSDMRLIFKHILPNALGTIVTSSVLKIPGVIFSEATLSYLGLGLKGVNSFGTMLSENQIHINSNAYLILIPAFIISLLMISFNLFGNGLRDALNPSLKGSD